MDLKEVISHHRLIWAPRYSVDEVKSVMSELNIDALYIDIMDFKRDEIKGHDCIVVTDSYIEKEDSEEEDALFFKRCVELHNTMLFARHLGMKYILLSDFGAGPKALCSVAI
jgi:hypothetical protein